VSHTDQCGRGLRKFIVQLDLVGAMFLVFHV
jgi:hypothetical protein